MDNNLFSISSLENFMVVGRLGQKDIKQIILHTKKEGSDDYEIKDLGSFYDLDYKTRKELEKLEVINFQATFETYISNNTGDMRVEVVYIVHLIKD